MSDTPQPAPFTTLAELRPGLFADVDGNQARKTGGRLGPFWICTDEADGEEITLPGEMQVRPVEERKPKRKRGVNA